MLTKRLKDLRVMPSWRPIRSFATAVIAGTCVVSLLPAMLILSEIHIGNWDDFTRFITKITYIFGVPMTFVAAAMFFICLPLTWIFSRFGLNFWYLYLFFGGLSGFVVMRCFLVISFSVNDGLFLPTVGALSGAVTGLTWWGARRDASDREQDNWR